MNIKTLEEGFNKKHIDAVNFVLSAYHKAVRGDSKEDYYKLYYKMVKFFVETDENPYNVVSGWGDYRGTAEGFACFLQTVHHACVDDGEMCWINSKAQGPLMCFIHHHDVADFDDKYFKKVFGRYYDKDDCTIHPLYLPKHFDEWRAAQTAHEKESARRVEAIAEAVKRLQLE